MSLLLCLICFLFHLVSKDICIFYLCKFYLIFLNTHFYTCSFIILSTSFLKSSLSTLIFFFCFVFDNFTIWILCRADFGFAVSFSFYIVSLYASWYFYVLLWLLESEREFLEPEFTCALPGGIYICFWGDCVGTWWWSVLIKTILN